MGIQERDYMRRRPEEDGKRETWIDGLLGEWSSTIRAKFRVFPITASLMAACVVVFFLDPPASVFADSGLALEEGRYWTLATSLFLHVNILHLGLNMTALWVEGPEAEGMLGRNRFLLLYFLSGAAGGLLQALFSDPEIESVGASGAICGVFLFIATVRPQALIEFQLPAVSCSAEKAGYWLMGISLACAVFDIFPQIGHLSHLGGALAGMALAKLWSPQNQT